MKELLVENGVGWIYPVNVNSDKQLTESVLDNIYEDINSKSTGVKTYDLKNPPLEVYAVLQKADIENQNGRIYPKKLLEREVERYKSIISMGSSIGETNHPNSTTVNLNNLSVWITDVWWDGITVMAKLRLPVSRGFLESGICSLPADNISTFLAYGIKIGISSRGVGTVEKVGDRKIVQDDFEMLCWDFVNSPSTRNAWVDTKLDNLKQYVESEAPNISVQKTQKDNSFDKISAFIKKHNK